MFALHTESEIAEILAKRLKSERLRQNIRQKDLAAMSGLSEPTIKNLEKSGKVSLVNFIKVAASLGLAPKFESLFVSDTLTIREAENLQKKEIRKAARPRHAKD